MGSAFFMSPYRMLTFTPAGKAGLSDHCNSELHDNRLVLLGLWIGRNGWSGEGGQEDGKRKCEQWCGAHDAFSAFASGCVHVFCFVVFGYLLLFGLSLSRLTVFRPNFSVYLDYGLKKMRP